MLETFGYRVLTAREDEDSMRLYTADQTEIALVLTDMMKPLMDGPTIIRALRKTNPRIPIIASSGLAEKERAAEAEQLGVRNFLAKPFTAESLLKMMDGLIHEGSRSCGSETNASVPQIDVEILRFEGL